MLATTLQPRWHRRHRGPWQCLSQISVSTGWHVSGENTTDIGETPPDSFVKVIFGSRR